MNERVENPISRISRSIGLYAKEPGRTKPVPGTAFGALFKGLQHEPVLYRDIVLAALFSGLRKSIVCAMSWEPGLVHVQLDLRQVALDRDAPGNKTSKTLYYPLPDWLCEYVLKPRFDARDPDIPWVFPSKTRPHKNTTTIHFWAKRRVKKLGIKITPHKLRASFATMAEGLFGNSMLTSALLTHASGRKSALGEELQPGKSVTQGYVEKEAGPLQHAINLVNEAFLIKAGVSPVLHAPVPAKFGNYVVTHFDAKAMPKKLKGPVGNT